MALKEGLISMEGVVYEVLPDFRFLVKLQNGHSVMAYGCGKLKKFRIKIILGDAVVVEMSKSDLTRGRIKVRKDANHG